jgi:ABC-type sugar transport system substrate-binding protein
LVSISWNSHAKLLPQQRKSVGSITLRWLAFIAGFCITMPVWALSVTFINPGKTDEAYWAAAAQAMQVSAKSLGVDLDVLYAERNHLRAMDLARSLVARPKDKRPDYVVFSNDYATGTELLRIFEGSGIKSFMAFSRLTLEEEAQNGTPRQKFKDWIGSLEPVAEDAGYLTARALIQKARATQPPGPDGKHHLLALGGDRSTTSSIKRNAGLMRALAEAPDVVLDQMIFASWNREKAAEQSEWLFERFPNARLVWAGNDLMAFGAMQALEKRGGRPGKSVLFSGVNTSSEAMEGVKSGRLTALAGGHFIVGAWSLVMIHDYHHGRDFADEGLQLERSMFVLFEPALASTFQSRFGEKYSSIDFRRYSKVKNPSVAKYEFGFSQLLR